MANLKGNTFEKQRRDMNFKLFALGTKKNDDNLTHSHALLVKREMYFNDFANYMEQKGVEGKFNLLLNEENLNGFLEQRLDGLQLSTAKNYLSGFNSLLSGFKGVNLAVGVSESYFKEKFENIKLMRPDNKNTEFRGLQSKTALQELSQIRYESGVIGQLMLTHGYRISEALRIVSESEKYIKLLENGDYNISGVVGKGGKIYHDKTLSHRDMQYINNMKNIPSISSFNKDLKQIDRDLRAHDFRYTFAKNLFNVKVMEVGYEKALAVVSKALNHNRSEITSYYLSRS